MAAMDMPTQDEIDDAARDAFALLRAHLTDDDEAQEAILAGADLPAVIHTLCGVTLGALESCAYARGIEDAAPVINDLITAALQRPEGP
jgi:hypothetical protein